ncbi:olfactory receptor 10K1-like [Mugil cephalus]|uniref:olfactory receptor 10K1-like n=1 Tax=Mugil cephalus TaxID=48193 RepID=UPI001FB60435|nr:olfactory receptor 10K1-like [Mugil cephalus]
MNPDRNVTYITLAGHVEVDKYRYLYFVIMSAAYAVILCTNVTIVSLIVIHKNLHEPMYVFIAALLMNSVFLSTAIYPKLLIDFLSKKQVITYQACLFQVFLFYAFSSSEFLLLAAMSYDRYVSICKPLQYSMIMKKTTVTTFLFFAWLLPACQVSVPVIGNANTKLCKFSLNGIFCNNLVNFLHCVSSRALSIYGLIVMFNVALFPLLFIIFTYTRILVIAHQSCREVRKKAAQTCLPHLLVLINHSCLFTFDMVIIRLESDFPKTARFIMTLQIVTLNSLCNPIVYGLKMKEISKHLRKLFCRRKVN